MSLDELAVSVLFWAIAGLATVALLGAIEWLITGWARWRDQRHVDELTRAWQRRAEEHRLRQIESDPEYRRSRG